MVHVLGIEQSPSKSSNWTNTKHIFSAESLLCANWGRTALFRSSHSCDRTRDGLHVLPFPRYSAMQGCMLITRPVYKCVKIEDSTPYNRTFQWYEHPLRAGVCALLLRSGKTRRTNVSIDIPYIELGRILGTPQVHRKQEQQPRSTSSNSSSLPSIQQHHITQNTPTRRPNKNSKSSLVYTRNALLEQELENFLTGEICTGITNRYESRFFLFRPLLYALQIPQGHSFTFNRLHYQV